MFSQRVKMLCIYGGVIENHDLDQCVLPYHVYLTTYTYLKLIPLF